MGLRGLEREKVLATIVHLLDSTMIRIGNTDYAKTNSSFGLTTLANRHVRVSGSELRFRFKGKSGKQWNLSVSDRRVARIVRQIQELPGQHLFQYLDSEGEQRDVTSGDVNAYLKAVAGTEVTSKDFRTWAGTILTALALSEFEKFDSAASAKRNVRAAIKRVSARLGNTPSVCRKCYVHPEIINGYLAEALVLGNRNNIDNGSIRDAATLRSKEAAVLAFIRRRIEKRAAVLNGGG
jgi:DNA topoisomerase-1